jgi:CHAT domain-containing protein
MTGSRAFALSLLLLLAVSPCLAQDQKQLADLKVLFEKDPAAGFVAAERMFEEPKREGDLAGMMGIFTLVKTWSETCAYAAPCLAMAEAALPIAAQRGDWAAVGDIRWAQAIGGPLSTRRMVLLTQSATEAYARAGQEPPAFTYWKAVKAPNMAEAERSAAKWRAWIATTPGRVRLIAESLVEATEKGEDNRASGLAMALVEAAPDASPSAKTNLGNLVSYGLPLPGGERLLPDLRRWVVDLLRENPRNSAWLATYVMAGCGDGWSGHRDVFLETYNWCLQQMRNHGAPPTLQGAYTLPMKCLRFRRPEMVDPIFRLLLDLPMPADAEPLHFGYPMHLLHRGMAPDLRRALVEMQLDSLDWDLRHSEPSILDHPWRGFKGWQIAETAPEVQRAQWCLETGYQIADYAPNFPTAASRSRAATEAAAYFDKAGRADLAAQATEMAKIFAADDPKVKLQVALAAAQAQAREDKWEEVIKGLEPVVATAAPSGAAVQAALLLRQAQASLGKKTEAAQWLAQAESLLGRAKLSASERAGLLVTLSELTTDAAKKLALLKQAEAAATDAGLTPLSEKISQQIAELALSTGDLTAAEQALLDIVARMEEKREALAFDHILRQQWFADNLGPYQKLLRVEALRKSPTEALWIAEKMRARALADQLAWQKVDAQVAVAPEIRQRLAALREMRNNTYALLQRAMGGQQLTGTDIRGAYMPIRGAYMPIRGNLLTDQPLTEADLKELRRLLETLAKEETALASAVREQVPAYAAASEAPILTGTRLIEKVLAQKDLALLHYTLCEGGLVVVACGPGSRPKVALLPIKPDDLWQQIGQFRQDIWERKPEVNAEAAKLYSLLVQPVEGIFYGAKRLWVVADGALQLVPFGALIGTDRNYLVSRFAIATTPSLSLAISSRGQRTPGQGTVILAAPDTGAIALPETDDKRGAYMPIRGMYLPVRGAYMPIRGEGVSSALTAMAMVPLPGAKAEGEAIAAQFQPSTLLTDKQATKAKLLAEGSECDLLHIATHGYADPEYPEFSGLLVAGEGEKSYDTLTAQEVYMWQLRARLVTLSACQTAMGKTVEGEGVMGLTRAFIFAGAQDVLCTLWPVADESTKALMTAFYTNLKTNLSIEEALRLAQASLAAKRDTAHPFFWAGFVAVRGPE